jgi:hypothetical protein
MTNDPMQRSVVVLDVESSSERSNPEIGKLRSAMYRVLDEAVQRAGLAGHDIDIDIEDRGDGALIVVDAGPLVLLDPFAEHLIAVLQEENAAVEAVSWLRLRVALHSGLVHRDAHGWSGDTINATFAICDAPAVKATLQRADRAQLVLVVSDLLYKQVVRHRYGSINPATYGNVDVQRIGEPAWVRVPGYPAAPVDEDEPGQPDPSSLPREADTRIGSVFYGDTTVHGPVIGRDQHNHLAPPRDRHG